MPISNDFEQYLRDVGALPVPAQECDGCGRDDDRCWQEDGPSIYCERCMRYQFGVDQEEDAVTYAAIEGLVKGLAERNVPLALIRAACDHALDQAELAAQREIADTLRRYGVQG